MTMKLRRVWLNPLPLTTQSITVTVPARGNVRTPISFGPSLKMILPTSTSSYVAGVQLEDPLD
jgi:hypothetical protein